MNKAELFDEVKKDYSKYISYCASRFYEEHKYFLDIIYHSEDMEQMVYLQLWKYIGRYDKTKSSLKSYIVMIMKSMFSKCLYLSNAEKRQIKKACSLNQKRVNDNGDTMTLEDMLVDTTVPNKDDNLSEFFYRQILKETYNRIYDLVKQGYSYGEIGKMFNVSRQRIGQIMKTIGKDIRKYEN